MEISPNLYLPDHYVKASPACKRAVLETVEALRKEGHECIEFKVPDGMFCPHPSLSFLTAD